MANYLKNPVIVILILIIFAVALFSIGKGMDGYVPAQNPVEVAAVGIGDTVLSGQQVVDSSKIRKVPVLNHPEYLIEDLKSNQFTDFFMAITTGSVQTPINQITTGNISRYGNAIGFGGPGMVVVNGSKLVVKSPDTFVWGYKTAYTVAVKTDKGIDIKTQNKTVKTVAAADISNNTVQSSYVTDKDLKEWYNDSDVGDQIGLDFSLSSFSDGRNSIPPSEIVRFFGNDTVKYMSDYPSGSPVIVYNGASSQNVIGSANSVLEGYAEYDNNLRAENAKTFVKAWNNTIVPPHTSASGKETVSFVGVYDPEEGGYPSHGACPPGRALRAAVMSAGCPLPSGMSSGFFSVSIDANPATGIKVYNPTSNPIKIVMWTSGSGVGMQIFAQAIEYIP